MNAEASFASPVMTTPFASVRQGARAELTSLRTLGVIRVVLLSLIVTLVVALVERLIGHRGATDRTLDFGFSFIIPLSAFGLVATFAAGGNLKAWSWPLARYGYSRALVTLGGLGARALFTAALGALVGMFGVLCSYGRSSPALGYDLLTSSWVGALVGFAYAAWFGLASTFGKRGGGRNAFLVLDFLFGGTAVGIIVPRAHALLLLGLDRPIDVSQKVSSLLLLAMGLVMLGLASLRARD